MEIRNCFIFYLNFKVKLCMSWLPFPR